MKNLNVVFVAILSIFTLFACEENTNAETVKAEIKETADQVESAFDRESTELKVELERAKTKVDEKIADLKVKWAAASGDAKTKLDQELEELKYHQDQLANDLEHLGNKIEDGWDKFKANAKKTLKKVDEDLEEINESL